MISAENPKNTESRVTIRIAVDGIDADRAAVAQVASVWRKVAATPQHARTTLMAAASAKVLLDRVSPFADWRRMNLASYWLDLERQRQREWMESLCYPDRFCLRRQQLRDLIESTRIPLERSAAEAAQALACEPPGMHLPDLGDFVRDACDARARREIEDELIAEGIEPRRARRIAETGELEDAEALAAEALEKIAIRSNKALPVDIVDRWERLGKAGMNQRNRASRIAENLLCTPQYVRHILRKANIWPHRAG